MDSELILAILEKLLMYGPAAVVTIAKQWDNGNKPTVEDIKNLEIVRDARDYF